MYKWNNSKCN